MVSFLTPTTSRLPLQRAAGYRFIVSATRPRQNKIMAALYAPHPGSSSTAFLQMHEYKAPSWTHQLKLVPTHRYHLGMLPTPIHPWALPGLPDGVQMWIKRDDLTGMQMSGNKVRKLEFLMAHAKQQGHDCVITIGGIQSNHCRATAVAAKYLGLGCHLLLRTSRQLVDQDPGLVGNLLLDRLVGAHIHLVTKEEYTRLGSEELGRRLVQQLQDQGLNPYLIPVGGSSPLGTWGYLQAIEEIQQQTEQLKITDIVMACGSGGTTAGLALGSHLSGLGAMVHAYGVCDSEDYFYDYVDGLLHGLGATPETVRVGARALFQARQAKGAGYAISVQEELQTVQAVAAATGVLLDPVYSAKAVHYLLQDMQKQPGAWRGKRILFVHTGGLLGMYDKLDQLQPLVEQLQPVHRMTVG